MESIDAYEGLVQIIEAGSLSAAARELGVPRPTLSRRLADLERGLGVQLLHRGARGALPTRAGEALYHRVRPVLEALREAESAARRMDGVPRGLLRLSISPAAAGLVAPLLDRYAARCPEVQLEVLASNRYVDLKAEQFDVAIRGGVLADSDLIGRLLTRSEVFPMASPDYLVDRGAPADAAALADHPCLLGCDPAGRSATRWPLRGGGRLRVRGGFVSNDRSLLKAAAVSGRGIALLSRIYAQPELESGALVPVLRDQIGAPIGMYAVYAARGPEGPPPRIRAFVDEAVAWFGEAAP